MYRLRRFPVVFWTFLFTTQQSNDLANYNYKKINTVHKNKLLNEKLITFLKQMTDTYWPFQSDCVSVQLKAVKFDKAELCVSTSIQLFSIPPWN